MRVDVKLVRVEEFIQYDAPCWQPVVRVILVILVAELVDTDSLTAEAFILVLQIPSPPI